MCGIAGIIGKNLFREKEREKLKEMIHLMLHRGPDGVGYFESNEVLFGMCRLSIIDLSSEGLCPLVYRNPRTNKIETVLTYNGEIYNYVELKNELKKLGHEFRTTSDSEVLLHAYRRWGEKCLERLNGMFAFALYDAKKKNIFIARDRAGEKPFYYFENGKMFIFASEIKAIAPFVGTSPIFPFEFQALEYCFSEKTIFKNIKCLPPAHVISINLKNEKLDLKIWEYWNVAKISQQMKTPKNFKKAVDHIEDLLKDSVRIRLRADVPCGNYLSGGIDSALIATFSRVKTAFTCHFPYGEKYDEFEYVKATANKLKIDLKVIRPTKKDFKKYFDQVVYHLDMPVGSFSAFPLYMLAKEAHKYVKIILSGEGADEIFGGYTRYLIPANEEWLYKDPELTNYKSLIDYYLGSALKRYAWLLRRGDTSSEKLEKLIQPFFTAFKDIVNAMGYTDFKIMLVILLQMEDRTASAFGIENRSPFLDHRLIEYAFTLPGEWKIGRRNANEGLVSKLILKEMAYRHLPKKVVERKGKQGLIAPINLWLNASGMRGEFDRQKYNRYALARWKKIFFNN